MSAPLRKLAVLGLGLLGGSIAAGARSRGLAREVVGSGRRRDALERARRDGIVDAVAAPAEAVQGADLVILATPVGSMGRVLASAAPGLAAGTVVSDVGSVKTALCETLPGLLPPGVHYVGAHPMAGSHLRGVEHARAELLEGAACIVTPADGAPESAVARVSDFFAGLGARVVTRTPARHDAEVAWISHVPHALAFAFAVALEAAPAESGEVAGPGFRDFTRIAHSEAEMWSEILAANRKAVAGPLQASADALQALSRAIEAGNAEAIERFVAQGRAALARITGPPVAGATPAGSSNARSGGQAGNQDGPERSESESNET